MLKFNAASKLDPISLDDLFASIAIFASCLIFSALFFAFELLIRSRASSLVTKPRARPRPLPRRHDAPAPPDHKRASAQRAAGASAAPQSPSRAC